MNRKAQKNKIRTEKKCSKKASCLKNVARVKPVNHPYQEWIAWGIIGHGFAMDDESISCKQTSCGLNIDGRVWADTRALICDPIHQYGGAAPYK